MSESSTEELETPEPTKPKPKRKSASAGRKRASSKKASSARKRASSKKASSAKKSTRERKTQPLTPALISRVKKLSKSGKKLQEIADALNKSKETTARGLPWTTQNVWHVLHRK